MKNKLIALFLLYFLYISVVVSQKFINETTINDFASNKIRASIEFQNFFYVISSSQNQGDQFEIKKFALDGTLIFSKPLDLSYQSYYVGYNDVISIIVSPDNHLICYGSAIQGGCDFGNNPFSFVTKYDTNGDLVWSNIRHLNGNIYNSINSNIVAFQNGNYLIKLSHLYDGISTYFEINNSGIFIDSLEVMEDFNETIFEFANYYFVKSNHNILTGVDFNGNEISQIYLSNNIVSNLPINDDTLLICTNNSLLFYDSNLNEIGSIDFPNFSQIIETSMIDDEVFSILFKENGTFGLLKFDADYSITDTIWFNDPHLSLSQAKYNDTHPMAIDQYNFSEPGYKGIRLQLYDLTLPESNNYNTDVKLSEINIINTQYYNLGPTSIYASPEIEVTFINTGIDTLLSVTVQSVRGISPLCNNYWIFKKTFDDLFLLPGDTVTKYVGWLSFGNGISIINNPVNQDFCVYLTNPNQRMDNNQIDNRLCKSLTIYSSVNETDYDKDFKIYPNPTQNEFFISLENFNEPNLRFKIIDISGKEVLQSFANTNTAIDISSLPNGYYIVQVEIGEQVVSKSLIVNR